MHKLDSCSATPLYQQLYDELKAAIQQGIYKSGEQIPPEDKLCEMYGISRVTVRKALEQLTEDGILVKRHGKGTFVTEVDYVEPFDSGGSFTSSCVSMGAVPTTRILSLKVASGNKKIEKILKIAPGKELITIERLRCVDGVPVILEVDYFPSEYRFLFEQDLENQSLFQILREKGMKKIHNFQDVFGIHLATKEQSLLLNCAEKHPLLCVKQTVYGTDGGSVYYNEQYILSDRYKYSSNILVFK